MVYFCILELMYGGSLNQDGVLNSYKTKKSELLRILLYRSDFSVYFRTAWAQEKGDVGLLCG